MVLERQHTCGIQTIPNPGGNPIVVATDCIGHALYGIVPTIERLHRKSMERR